MDYSSARLLLFVFVLIWGACGNPNDAATQEKAPEIAVIPANPLGESVFRKNCMICHMENGMGIPGLNPPLSETKWVNGEPAQLIHIVLNGLNEPIEVKGKMYQGVMASHAHLSDSEIAAVLTYVRSSFGNTAGPISEIEVANVRAAEKESLGD